MDEELNQELTEEQLSELLQIRRDKLEALRADGKDPFVLTSYPVDACAKSVRENCGP